MVLYTSPTSLYCPHGKETETPVSVWMSDGSFSMQTENLSISDRLPSYPETIAPARKRKCFLKPADFFCIQITVGQLHGNLIQSVLQCINIRITHRLCLVHKNQLSKRVTSVYMHLISSTVTPSAFVIIPSARPSSASTYCSCGTSSFR